MPDWAWRDRLRPVLTSPELRGNYLIVTAATQRALAAAIVTRTGADPSRTMLPEVLAGAVSAASEAALRRWSEADAPTRRGLLVREALAELATAWPSAEAALRATALTGERRPGERTT